MTIQTQNDKEFLNKLFDEELSAEPDDNTIVILANILMLFERCC